MEAVPPRNFPREKGTPVQTLPVQDQGPRPFYPPVCLQYHWDPTMILRHTLPETSVPLPMDPRPWVKVCLEYTTSGENQPAPAVNPSAVLPVGGEHYPPTLYQAAIDNESRLRRLDRHLGVCEADQYEPSPSGDMFNSRLLVPNRKQPADSRFVSELAMPQALLRSGPYPCREAEDKINLSRSSSLFWNATKQDKYKQSFPTKQQKPLLVGASP
uniref:Uncharacterized protein n=1 Tax=viral metagenome TaxID=1070528 RepID=A0A6C0BCG5_9ZZZZ